MDLSSQPPTQNQHHHHHLHLSRRPRRRTNAAPPRTIHPLVLSDPSRLRKKKKKQKTSFSIPDPPSPSPSSPPPPLSVQRPRMQACSVGEESDEGNPSQQQAVLESLAAYLEGELLSRLQSYSELLVEAEGMSRERSFYCAKLLQIEKVCKHVQPYKANITKLDTVLSILSTNVDMPFV